MGISKQIGWSPEANLYYQISQQLKRLIGIMSKVVLTPPVPVIPNLTLMIDNSPNFDIPSYLVDPANSDFTIEWWSKLDVDNNHPRPWSIGSWNPNPLLGAAHAVSIESGQFYYWIGGTIVLSATLPQPYINTWSYFTITRYKDAIGIYQNGVSLGYGTYTGAIPTNGLPLYLGSEGNDSVHKGRMSNFRWSSENLYSVPSIDFTPPTIQLTVLPTTKLLIFQGTSLNDEIKDQSLSGYTITNASGLYDLQNPLGAVGCIDFTYELGFTFKVDNTSGNAGQSYYSQIDTFVSCMLIFDWGDGSSLEYLYGGDGLGPVEFSHTFTSNNIFNVKVYLNDPTNIFYIDCTANKGNFHMLEVDCSKLVNLTNIYIDENKLPSTQINKLLSELVNNGLFGGVLQTFSQTPLAPPTGQGLIDKATLISRSWTVSTD